jgi:hypothetical protein
MRVACTLSLGLCGPSRGDVLAFFRSYIIDDQKDIHSLDVLG